jgi:type II secretory pathway pseudopilin PulG
MRNKRRQFGVTLTEMTVVIGIAALMLGLAVPAANMLLNSFESESGAKSIISSAMASARAIAAKEQRYAGIRFQKRYDPSNPDPLKASQYIIFIVKDDLGNLTNGFRAVDGIQPIKLPDSIGVMDLVVRPLNLRSDSQYDAQTIGYQTINDNSWIDEPLEVNDTTAFSIVFSPSGKLVIHEVRIRNRNKSGIGAWRPSTPSDSGYDNIFNSPDNIINGLGMFVQDDYAYLGYGYEYSRNSFVIYDTKKFKQAYNNGKPYTNYLNQLRPIYINPYTGTIINEK